jgi:hypothetical protein
MEDNHRAPRRRVLKAGSINSGGGSISCTVRNISDTGAAIEVDLRFYLASKPAPQRGSPDRLACSLANELQWRMPQLTRKRVNDRPEPGTSTMPAGASVCSSKVDWGPAR